VWCPPPARTRPDLMNHVQLESLIIEQKALQSQKKALEELILVDRSIGWISRFTIR
jgi:hypothetical protein